MAVAVTVGFGMMIVSVTLVTTPTGYMVPFGYGDMLSPALVAEDYYAASVKENCTGFVAEIEKICILNRTSGNRAYKGIAHRFQIKSIVFAQTLLTDLWSLLDQSSPVARVNGP